MFCRPANARCTVRCLPSAAGNFSQSSEDCPDLSISVEFSYKCLMTSRMHTLLLTLRKSTPTPGAFLFLLLGMAEEVVTLQWLLCRLCDL